MLSANWVYTGLRVIQTPGNKVRTLHNSKRDYFCKLIGSKPRLSNLWLALKSALPCPTQNWSCFSEGAKELASKFNHYFVTAASSLPSTPLSTDESSINPTPSSPDAASLSLLTIDTDECHSRLSAINPHKSTGLDGIPASLLKTASLTIVSPLCSIINSSIQSGSFPSSWKCALVKLSHKGGSGDELSNYWPTSLLPVGSKILESVVKDQVYSHVNNLNLLYHWQSGFRPGHSTTTTLLHVTNECFRALDNGLFVGVVFLDISKAFDTVLWTMTFSYHAFGTLTSTQSPDSGFNPICLTGASALPLIQSTLRIL